MSELRKIFRSASTSNAEVSELLQAIFVAESIIPSEEIWLVSPWLTDLEILDNRSAAFSAVGHQWGARRIRLTELLSTALESSRLFVVTRPDRHNDTFIQKLRDLADAAGTSENLTIRIRETLHIKGLLGQDYYLSGSMNFTFNGVEIHDEGIDLDTSPDSIAQARIAFHEHYGEEQ
jgi:hypothetical protein